MAVSSPQRRADTHRLFHGWLIVLTAFLCHAVNVGLIFYSWGVFLTPLSEHFGSRAIVATGYSCMQFAAAAMGLGIGPLVDRHGARPIQLVGAAALALGFFGMSQVDSIPALYLCFIGPLALGLTTVGGLPANAAVARWFIRRRGTALGIATAGISFGGIVFAPLTQYLIDHVGWRGAYAVLGGLVLLVVVPPVLAFMVRDPADMGLWPDGHADDDEAATEANRQTLERELERSVTPRVAMGDRSFYLLAASFALTMSGIAGTLLFLIPLLTDYGMSASTASTWLAATAFMGMVGKLGFGALLDRLDQRLVAAACFALQAGGVGILLIGHTTPLLVGFVLLYGYAMGGNATLQASLVGEVFGRLHYGAISARMMPFVVVSQAFTVPLVGWTRDHYHTYAPALVAIIAACLLAVICVSRVRIGDEPLRLRRPLPSPT
jgi:MFS family permease